jgi:hypothetical protein
MHSLTVAVWCAHRPQEHRYIAVIHLFPLLGGALTGTSLQLHPTDIATIVDATAAPETAHSTPPSARSMTVDSVANQALAGRPRID